MHWILDDLVSGRAVEAFAKAPFDRLVLPHVTNLVFWITDDHNSGYTDQLDETQYAQVFCEQIRRMFPNAQGCDIAKFQVLDSYREKPLIRALTSGLFSDKSSIHAPYLGSSNNLAVPDSIANLSSIMLTYTNTDSPMNEVIRRNASTLKFVHLVGKNASAFQNLIINESGIPVVYPRVQTLKLNMYANPDPLQISTYDSPSVHPFPQLCLLECCGGYPFDNDILFRGNEETLQVLRIEVYPNTIKSIKQSIYPHIPLLKSLRVVGITQGEDSDETITEEAVQLLFALSRYANIVQGGDIDARLSQMQISVDEIGRYVKTLDIAYLELTMSTMLRVIKSLPLLRLLYVGLEPTPELYGADRSHDSCLGECRYKWEQLKETMGDNLDIQSSRRDDSDGGSVHSVDSYHRHHRSSFGQQSFLLDYLLSHLDAICTDMGIMDDIYSQYYPLSESLVVVDCSSHDDDYMPACRMFVILALLCPRLEVIDTSAGSLVLIDAPADDCGNGGIIEKWNIRSYEAYARLSARLGAQATAAQPTHDQSDQSIRNHHHQQA
ncbi:hypothetical protein FBU59_000733 [Linderina macrospora]|uniref:Uncharacterized protein n=1 Tax=Linderina macrospora TaxID=4868 RepID=A0ACC1JFT8_9FUNG|nr:hypothetical protein FBU59_000733 [Linderina macrospora]